jgi:hypothetical protein
MNADYLPDSEVCKYMQYFFLNLILTGFFAIFH